MIDVVDLDEAARLLVSGAVVALPTDTVYGVGASLVHPSALASLFDLKHRPGSLALPVLVESVAQIEALGVTWPDPARELGRAFWPGALTIVVPVDEALATRVGSSSRSAGFRIPDDVALLHLLGRCGPLAVTSANEHGEPPCHSVLDVRRSFAHATQLDGVVDGGERHGAVSTVVELTAGSWRVLRDGAISSHLVAAVLERDETRRP